MNQNNGWMGRRSFLNLTGTGGMALVAAVAGSAFGSSVPGMLIRLLRCPKLLQGKNFGHYFKLLWAAEALRSPKVWNSKLFSHLNY
jgi:hypothetical protein